MSKLKEQYKKEELEKLGIILSIDEIDESKIDLTKKPADFCIMWNLCNQFNIPYPKSLPKRIYVGDIEWTEKARLRFEEIMKKKIKSAFRSDIKYSWFRFNCYPHNKDWLEIHGVGK